MPCLTSWVIGLPFQLIKPLSDLIKSKIIRKVVVFPAPFCPINPMIEPSSTVMSRFSTAILSPNCLVMRSILNIFVSLADLYRYDNMSHFYY